MVRGDVVPAYAPLLRHVRQEQSWLMAAFGVWAGCLLYFLHDKDPLHPLELGLLLIGVALIGAAWGRARWLFIGLLMLGGSYSLTAWQQLRAERLGWPQVVGHSFWMVGQIAEIRPQADNPRRNTLKLAPVQVFGLPGADQLQGLRLGVWAQQLEGIAVGDAVATKVRILPPRGPNMPWTRDSRYWAWSNPKLPAAYAVTKLYKTESAQWLMSPHPAWHSPLTEPVAAFRGQVIAQTQGLAQGTVTALLVGEQSAIPPAVQEAYRETGLSHLLAISGMQMALVGLGVFWMLRYAGASMPTLALRLNLKVVAALTALAVVVGYTLLTGGQPSILRAALMVGLVLLAVVMGRVRGLLRAWAIANMALLLMVPEFAMSAGLQLSSAASLALGCWGLTVKPPRGVVGWFGASLVATAVAGAATASIAVAHFGQLAPLSLLANAVAIPLMTLAVYAGMFALLLWPVGLEGLGLMPMTWLAQTGITWATWLSTWQGVGLRLGADAAWVMALVAIVVLLLAFMQRYGLLALFSVAVMVLGLAWAHNGPRPNFVVAADGRAGWGLTPNGYATLWAEKPSDAAFLARRAGLPLAPKLPHDEPPCCAEGFMLPPVSRERYAYALWYDEGVWQGWQVVPHRCHRAWQKYSESCQLILSEEDEDDDT